MHARRQGQTSLANKQFLWGKLVQLVNSRSNTHSRALACTNAYPTYTCVFKLKRATYSVKAKVQTPMMTEGGGGLYAGPSGPKPPAALYLALDGMKVKHTPLTHPNASVVSLST
eukprot:879689-Prorocentrum_minimum.AAC.2